MTAILAADHRFKRGTGGTAGVLSLAKVVDRVFFPELLTVRGKL